MWVWFRERCFESRLVETGPLVLGRKISEFRQCILLFYNYFPLKKIVPLIWTSFNPFHLRTLSDALGLNWPAFFLTIVYWNVNSLFLNYILLGKKCAPNWKKSLIPSTKVAMYQVCKKLILEKKKLFHKCICATLILSSFGKGRDPSFKHTCISHSLNMLCARLKLHKGYRKCFLSLVLENLCSILTRCWKIIKQLSCDCVLS